MRIFILTWIIFAFLLSGCQCNCQKEAPVIQNETQQIEKEAPNETPNESQSNTNSTDCGCGG